MTFKIPSIATYAGSLLIAAPVAALTYWVLLSQQMASNGLIILGIGLFIGHLAGACFQASTPQKHSTTRPSAKPTAATQSDDVISLYVGNLAYRAQREDLQALFAQYGPVNSVRIMIDRATRRPRGYAFIEMDRNAALKALKQLDNTEFCGRNLRVSEAKQRQ